MNLVNYGWLFEALVYKEWSIECCSVLLNCFHSNLLFQLLCFIFPISFLIDWLIDWLSHVADKWCWNCNLYSSFHFVTQIPAPLVDARYIFVLLFICLLKYFLLSSKWMSKWFVFYLASRDFLGLGIVLITPSIYPFEVWHANVPWNVCISFNNQAVLSKVEKNEIEVIILSCVDSHVWYSVAFLVCFGLQSAAYIRESRVLNCWMIMHFMDFEMEIFLIFPKN